MYAIETTNLSKSFKGMHAVNNLNLHVPVGSIYGFIGFGALSSIILTKRDLT